MGINTSVGSEQRDWMLKAMQLFDSLTSAERSERMSRIRSSGTKIEMKVRRLVHSMGYRYRLHARDIFGNPDLAFRPRMKVIFANGCFWHQHGCGNYRMPKSRQSFWLPKLAKNKIRDELVLKQLRQQGWKALVIWECQVKRESLLRKRLKSFLEPNENIQLH